MAAAVLMSGVKQIIAETPNEFLRSFSIEDFENTRVMAYLNTFAVDARKLGTPSGGGQVFNFDDSMVLKTVSPCTNPPPPVVRSSANDQLCSMAENGSLIFRIPNTLTKKHTIFAPNYIIEVIMALMIEKLSLYTPSFVRSYDFQYNEATRTTYTLIEKLSPLVLMDEHQYLFVMFQLFHALNAAQRAARFTHFDLHAENVMLRPTRGLRIYPLPDGIHYLHTITDTDAVIIDFGHSRMETEDSVLTGRLHFAFGNPPFERVDKYEFNPYYDLFSILVSLYRKKGNKKPGIEPLFRKLMEAFGNGIDLIAEHRIGKIDHWRPKADILSTQRVKTAQEMISVTADLFIQLQSRMNIQMPANVDQLNAALRLYPVIITNKIIKLPGARIYPSLPLKKQMNVRYNRYSLSDAPAQSAFGPIIIRHVNSRAPFVRSPWNITGDEDPAIQMIHIARINPLSGGSDGYNFRFDCCRLDPRSFMQEPSIIGGIVINAGFFQIKGDFTPVGHFQTADYVSNTPLNPVYERFFRAIVKTEDGGLDIVPLEDAVKFSEFFTCGPILVEGGGKFTSDLFDIKDNGKYIFKCQDQNAVPRHADVPNCNDGQPGDLSHAANLNPRTALAIQADGTVLFIYVEGRKKRGGGMDLVQLANMCVNLGAVKAVNLDGGQSSQFVWRQPGKNIIEMSNPDHMYSYPVGTLLSYVKSANF